MAGIRIIRLVMQSRVVFLHWNPAELQRCFWEFIMIHHLARAFHVRENPLVGATITTDGARPASAPVARPVRPRPITPWSAPVPSASNTLSQVMPLRVVQGSASRVRISTDPCDARRTVIAGRFAEVCAALDRLVRAQEAAA